MFEKHLRKSNVLSKYTYQSVTSLLNKLPGFCVGGTSTISRLIVTYYLFNLFKCKQKLWESFNAFAMSDIESSKEGKGRKRLSGDENK